MPDDFIFSKHNTKNMISVDNKERQMKFISPEICTDNDCNICSVGMRADSDYDCKTEISRAKHDVILLCENSNKDFYRLNSNMYRDDMEMDQRLEEYGTMLLLYVKKYDKFQLHSTELIFRQAKLSSLVNINTIHEYYDLGKHPNKERICYDEFFLIYDPKKYKIEFRLAKKYFIWHCEMNGNNYFSHCDDATDKALKLNRYSLYFLKYLSRYHESAKRINRDKLKFLEKKLSKFINIDFIFEYYKLDKYGKISYANKWFGDYLVSLGLRYIENDEDFQETMCQMGLQIVSGYGCFYFCKMTPMDISTQCPDSEDIDTGNDQKKCMDYRKLLDIKKIVKKQYAPYIDVFDHINKTCHKKSDLLHNIVAFKKIAHKLNLVSDAVELVFIELKKVYIESYGISLFITHEYFMEKILRIELEGSCNRDISELNYDWLKINCQNYKC